MTSISAEVRGCGTISDMLLRIALAVVALGFATSFAPQGPRSGAPRQQSGADQAEVYTCPMHPEVVEPKPGRCPKCKMKLVLK